MQFPYPKKLRTSVVLALGAAFALAAPLAHAADNTGTGDIAGVGADLGDSNLFQLNTTTLGLVKRAFLASTGAALTTGDSLPKGTQVKFMLYINNSTGVPVVDVSVQDALNATTFAYVPGSIKVDNTLVSSVVCPAGVCNNAAIFAQVDGSGTALGDGDAVAAPVDADVASYNGGTSTIDVGNSANANNAQLDLAASNVWAVSFTVTMQ